MSLYLSDIAETDAVATPAGNPPSGRFWYYFKADGVLYRKDSTGVEIALITQAVINSGLVASSTMPANSYNGYNTASGALVGTLVDASTCKGQEVEMCWESGANALTVATTGGQLINGVAPALITFPVVNTSWTFRSISTGWRIV